MRTKKRLTKRISKQELKRDRFVDTTFDWALWIRENTRIVALAGGGLALVVLALLLYRGAQGRGSAEAAVRFDQVRQAYTAGNYQLAANDFKQFLNQYGDSDYADEATLYLADSYFKAGDYPAAVSALEDFERRRGDSPLRYGATSLLAASYEESGDLAKAAETYAEARDAASFDYQRAAALMDRGRVYTAQGHRDKAAEAYREVVEKYPEAPSVREASVRLAEVTVTPLTGAPSTGASPNSTADSTQAAGGVPVAPGAAGAETGVVGAETDDAASAASAVTPTSENEPVGDQGTEAENSAR